MGHMKEMYENEMQRGNPSANTSIDLFRKPLTLLEQTGIINNVILQIMNGEIDPLISEITLKSLENVITAIRKTEKIKSLINEEAQKYGKTFEKFGVKIENCTRTTYDYTVCKDDIYNDLVKQKKALDEQIKIREKQIKSGCDIVTGETFREPASSTTNFLKIIFPDDIQ